MWNDARDESVTGQGFSLCSLMSFFLSYGNCRRNNFRIYFFERCSDNFNRSCSLSKENY